MIVILYAEVGTKDFATFHHVLSEKAQKGEFVYILRHFVKVGICGNVIVS